MHGAESSVHFSETATRPGKEHYKKIMTKQHTKLKKKAKQEEFLIIPIISIIIIIINTFLVIFFKASVISSESV